MDETIIELGAAAVSQAGAAVARGAGAVTAAARQQLAPAFAARRPPERAP